MPLPTNPRVLIIGASGGIGQAMTSAFADRFTGGDIVASYRREAPVFQQSNVRTVSLDATEETAIARLASELNNIDVLVNCIGYLHVGGRGPEKTIRKFEPDNLAKSIEINTLPTLLLGKHFGSLLKQSTPTVFATLSAKVGSIEDNHLGGWYSYRASKAALNMAIKTLSIEWQRAAPNCCVAALHPGTVATALSAPFSKNVPAEKLFNNQQCADYLMQVIDQLSPEVSGRFWSWDGTELPW